MPLLYYKYYTAKTTICTPYIEIRKEAVPLRFSVTERPLFLCADNHAALFIGASRKAISVRVHVHDATTCRTLDYIGASFLCPLYLIERGKQLVHRYLTHARHSLHSASADRRQPRKYGMLGAALITTSAVSQSFCTSCWLLLLCTTDTAAFCLIKSSGRPLTACPLPMISTCLPCRFTALLSSAAVASAQALTPS